MSYRVDVEFKADAILGEGAIWDSRKSFLYWVDIEKPSINVYNPVARVNKSIKTEVKVSAVVPKKSGGLIIATEKGFASFDLDTNEMTFICNPEPDRINNRFNDGKCDPNGRFWAGSISLSKMRGDANLYRLDKHYDVKLMMPGVTNSNGIVWSSDKTKMYYIDTASKTLREYHFDNLNSEIVYSRDIIKLDRSIGSMDGMSIDSNDNLWVCLYRGSSVICVSPSLSKVVDKIEMPTPNITSCAFGGDNLSTLYITTASQNMSEEDREHYPLAGSLFSVDMGDIRGVPSNEFDG